MYLLFKKKKLKEIAVGKVRDGISPRIESNIFKKMESRDGTG